jgi:hypothetical protein
MSAETKKIVVEGFVTGGDATWRMDVSKALDGDERSSITPLFVIFEREFGHLCAYEDTPYPGYRHVQFGAFRITIESVEHPRNDAYRERGRRQQESDWGERQRSLPISPAIWEGRDPSD